MAWLSKSLQQRIIGALMLLALAVIFLPILFSRNDLSAPEIEVPKMPAAPPLPVTALDPVPVAQLKALPDESETADSSTIKTVVESDKVDSTAPQSVNNAKENTEQPAIATKTDDAMSRLDVNGLPISWSVQLASLTSQSSAEALQNTLRKAGYHAYIRVSDNVYRVFVGPVIERSEAESLRATLEKQHKINGFIVRFKPERS